MEIIVGTYEEITFGYRLVRNQSGFGLQLSFTNHSHTGCVKAVSTSTNLLLATGSSDETICLLNLKTRKEIGTLSEHEGAITSLKFYGLSHLFSASVDCNICIWDTNNWHCLKTLRGHKKEVTCLSVHPSGKLALSVSKDKTLRTWNLISGRAAYTINIKQVGHLVEWSPNGTHFAVVLDRRINVYKLETAEIIYSIDFEEPVMAIVFLNTNSLITAGENGHINIYDILTCTCKLSFKAHSNRIKGLCCIPSVDCENKPWLVSVSSDGYIKIWSIDCNKSAAKTIAEINTSCRLTCVTVIRLQEMDIKQDLDIVDVKEESEEDNIDLRNESVTEIKTPETLEFKVSQKRKLQEKIKSKKKHHSYES